MIGDDIVSDIGGAQACGMMGVQVRTGKFRSVYKQNWFCDCQEKLKFVLHIHKFCIRQTILCRINVNHGKNHILCNF